MLTKIGRNMIFASKFLGHFLCIQEVCELETNEGDTARERTSEPM